MEIQSDQHRMEKQEARIRARNHQNHGGLLLAMRSMNVGCGSRAIMDRGLMDSG